MPPIIHRLQWSSRLCATIWQNVKNIYLFSELLGERVTNALEGKTAEFSYTYYLWYKITRCVSVLYDTAKASLICYSLVRNTYKPTKRTNSRYNLLFRKQQTSLYLLKFTIRYILIPSGVISLSILQNMTEILFVWSRYRINQFRLN